LRLRAARHCQSTAICARVRRRFILPAFGVLPESAEFALYTDIIIILASIVVTSFLSGLLSLGGGTILMGVFVWILPVSVAMLLHGVTQFASNGSRAVVYWKYIHWPVIGGYLAGAV